VRPRINLRQAGRAASVLALVCAVAPLLQGCAYFNGMYNANHWSAQAERSERAGRVAEARDRWRMAAIHADSVLSRHPHSRWANDAVLVRGRALVHLDVYSEAIGALEAALPHLSSGSQRATAQLYLGRADFAQRRLPEALEALDSAVAGGSARQRSEALLYRGRVLLAMGWPAAALEDFLASAEPAARFERARAALAGGQPDLAAQYLDGVALVAPVQDDAWLPLLESLARAGLAQRSSDLVAVVAARADAPRGPRARLLLADGDRLHAAHRDSAASVRWQEVVRSVPDSAEARSASVRLAQLDIVAAASADSLAPVGRRLELLVSQGGESGNRAQELVRLLELVDTLAHVSENADACWYLRAELVRDSLSAPAAAAAAFAEMAVRFPDSPWTPKALVAATVAGHPAADSLRALLMGRYAESPYAAAALGRPGLDDRYAVLEDSLRLALAGVEGAAWPAGVSGPLGPGGVRAGPPRPGARPTVRPGVRPVEP